jgi:hypothetical protein
VPVPPVYALVRSGDLPAIKIGGRGVWRVDRAKLDAYLEQLEEQTADWAKAHPPQPERKGRTAPRRAGLTPWGGGASKHLAGC